MNIFLAGPFFNEPCKIVLNNLLYFLENQGHKVFCAMRDGALVPKDAPEEIRNKYFLLDFNKVVWCDCMVALLSYPLPIEQTLCLKTSTPDGTNLKNMVLPDMGTVFEIGCAYGLSKPVIGYVIDPIELNLMLTQSCCTVVTDEARLKGALHYIEREDFGALKLMKKHTELFQL
jgi:nucleoside 2-deoxyribosyltransferase